MQVRLEDIANELGGTLLGDPNVKVENALPLQDAGKGDLTLLDSVQHIPRFLRSGSFAAIVPEADSQTIFVQSKKPVVAVSNLHAAFIQAIQILRPSIQEVFQGIHPLAVVDPTASIAKEVYIGPNATIGRNSSIAKGCRIHAGTHLMEGCHVGEDCEIFPGCVLYPGTILGKRVMLHACAVLGAFGFGYSLRSGRHERTAQLGWVELGDDVEVGANTTIDRGTYGPTRIGEGTKLDNQIQIGHNAHIGKHNLMCAQVGIAGSSSTGDYVVLGGQVGVRDHVHIGDRCSAAAQSGIARDLQSNETVMGTPAIASRDSTQVWILSQRLPEMKRQLKELAASIAAIQSQLASPTEIRSKAA